MKPHTKYGLTLSTYNNKFRAAMKRIRNTLKGQGAVLFGRKQNDIISLYARYVLGEVVSQNHTDWLMSKYIAGEIKKDVVKSKPKPKKDKDLNRLAIIAKKECYAAFLETDYWKMVRLVVINRDGGKCACCGSDESIQVHHKTYENHLNEHNHFEDLVTLCRKCHAKMHKK
jgi:hypothetical protein